MRPTTQIGAGIRKWLLYGCCSAVNPCLTAGLDLEFGIGSGTGIRTLNPAVNRSLRTVQKWRSEFAECR